MRGAEICPQRFQAEQRDPVRSCEGSTGGRMNYEVKYPTEPATKPQLRHIALLCLWGCCRGIVIDWSMNRIEADWVIKFGRASLQRDQA